MSSYKEYASKEYVDVQIAAIPAYIETDPTVPSWAKAT